MSHRPFVLAAALAASLGASAGSALATPSYTFSYFADPANPTFTEAFGINDSGTVVGSSGAVTARGFVRAPSGAFTPSLGPFGAMNMVTGINAAGSLTGIQIDPAGISDGYTRIGTSFAIVNQPGTLFNQSLGIANSNETVGYSSAIDPAGQVGQKAYSQMNGVFTDINHLLPSNQNSQATGISNDASRIVGFYQRADGTSVGFLDIGGIISTIDPFGSAFTQALGVNNSGEIVGFYTDAAGNQHGYVDMNGVISRLDPPLSVNTTINGVNNLGQIVGFITEANDSVVSFVATPRGVPEPAPLAVLATALLGLVAVRRWRRV
jgi:uncharacterized membrane protein